ncbi:hypothetical protein [Burkholderia sp. L27(2015)]|jgi:hypothetical protein|uniref:hypothetical protein n=1 Tax=Burkholderia sp. L27(2015) TaxID=1641858 RepID=UPI00131B94F1|nr:hypothetical protein [Burkholderia sp. L27(2015)]
MSTSSDNTVTTAVQCAAQLQCIVLTRNLNEWLKARAASNSQSTSGQIVAELQRLMFADVGRVAHTTLNANVPTRMKKGETA